MSAELRAHEASPFVTPAKAESIGDAEFGFDMDPGFRRGDKQGVEKAEFIFGRALKSANLPVWVNLTGVPRPRDQLRAGVSQCSLHGRVERAEKP
jgi:hypothetical protein